MEDGFAILRVVFHRAVQQLSSSALAGTQRHRIETWPNWLALTIVALSSLYAVLALASFPKWTVDDAYITYRYAENLAHHGQLTWNVDLDPVEGYTGVALPVVLAGAIAVGADPDVASKTIGVLAFLLLALTTWRLCGRLSVSPLGKSAVLAGLCTAPFMFTHALSGLETVMFMACVVLAVDRAAAVELATRFERSLWLELSASTLVASLIRPEGVALSCVLLIACLCAEARRRPAPTTADQFGRGEGSFAVSSMLRALGIWIGVFVLPGAAYFAWRASYYGQLLPNTFYAKLHTGFVVESLVDVAKFAVLYLAVPMSVALVAVATVRRRALLALAGMPWRAAIAAIAFVAVCLALYSRSALVMNFGFRFFVPFYPIVLIGVAAVTTLALREVPTGRARTLVMASIVVLVVTQTGVHARLVGRSARDAAATERLLTEEHRKVGQFLRDRLAADATIVVVVDAGAIPYFSGLRTIDFGGLNDEFLSHRFRNRTRKGEIADYFFATNPSAIVFTSRVKDRIEGPEPVRVQDDARFANYELARVFSCEEWPEYHQLVYLRRDITVD